MSMYDPPHPGEFIRELYLEPLAVSSRAVAGRLKVSPSTFVRLLNGKSGVTPEMALRLSKTLGRSRRVGWRCKTATTCGMPAGDSISTRLKSSNSPRNRLQQDKRAKS